MEQLFLYFSIYYFVHLWGALTHSLLACPGCAPPGEYKYLQYPYSFGLRGTLKSEEWSFENATVLLGF